MQEIALNSCECYYIARGGSERGGERGRECRRFVSVCRSLSLSLAIGPEEGIDESEASPLWSPFAMHVRYIYRISISISLNQHMYSFKMTTLGELKQSHAQLLSIVGTVVGL